MENTASNLEISAHNEDPLINILCWHYKHYRETDVKIYFAKLIGNPTAKLVYKVCAYLLIKGSTERRDTASPKTEITSKIMNFVTKELGMQLNEQNSDTNKEKKKEKMNLGSIYKQNKEYTTLSYINDAAGRFRVINKGHNR